MTITRRQAVRTALLGLPALSFGIPSAPAAHSTTFLAQTSRVELLTGHPSGLLLIDGYPALESNCATNTVAHPGTFTGIPSTTHPPLTARALALRSDKGDEPVILVSIDISGISRQIHDEVTSRFRGRVSDDRIALAASHTHSGLFGSGSIASVKYPRLLTDVVAGIAVNASENHVRNVLIALIESVLVAPMVAVNLRVDQSGTFATAHNRVPTCTPVPAEVDRQAPVMVAARLDTGVPYAVIFGAAAHPRTSMCPARGKLRCGCTDSGAWSQEMHSDYPGVAAAQVEAAFPGATALFVQGCAGDQDTVPGGTDGAVARGMIDLHGQALASTVIAAVGRALADGKSLLEGPIASFRRTMRLPYDIRQTFTNSGGTDPFTMSAAELRRVYLQRAASAPNLHARAHALYMATQPSIPVALPFPYLVWAFGGENPFVWFGLGDEVSSAYALRLREHFEPEVRCWVSGYINEVQSYVPTKDQIYSPTFCPNNIAVIYNAGWSPGTPFPYTPSGRSGVYDIASVLAEGSFLYYGQPSRFTLTIQDRILEDTQAIGEVALRAAMSCSETAAIRCSSWCS